MRQPIKALFFATSVATLIITAAQNASATVPDWVRQAAAVPVKASSYDDEIDAVVLLDEQVMNVSPSGQIVVQNRRAVRILRPQGRSEGTYSVIFSKEQKVDWLRAYGVNDKGEQFEAKDKEAVEVNLSNDGSLYVDERRRAITAPANDPGGTVAFEMQEKMPPYQHDDVWAFQEQEPVLVSRYVVNLPPGWELSTTFANHADIKPTISGNSYTWEVRDVPPIHREHRMPSLASIAAAMEVHLYSGGAHTPAGWAGVGAWQSQLAEGRRVASPEIQQRVRDLTATAPDFESKVRAITKWVQRNVRYVSIQIGIGGWQPHPAPDIYRAGYGDCKDKATLLSTMLKEAGIDSEYVLAYLGSRTHVVPQRVSPYAFNHVFVAIELPGNEFKDAPAVVTVHGKRWLLFDPTAEYLPVGELEGVLQGSYVLLNDHGRGELIRVPLFPSERNEVARKATLQLAADGSLSGEIDESDSGNYALELRDYLLDLRPDDRRKAIEHRMNEEFNGASLESVDFENLDDVSKEFKIHIKFKASRYAVNAGPLILVKPRVMGTFGGFVDRDDKPRQFAYEFESSEMRKDDFTIQLPAGFAVDELPKPVKSEFEFGRYTSTTEVKDNVLHYTRVMDITDPEVPVDHVPDVRRFFHTIAMDERGSAVFKKNQ